MQQPPDQKAFDAARNTVDPAQKLAALQAFVKNYPKSRQVGRAKNDMFHLLLKDFPDRTAEIDKQARAMVKHSGKGTNKLVSQSNLAEELAEAGPNGVDLPQAEKWAIEAVNKFNEPAFDKEMDKQKAAFEKTSKAKPPTPAEQKENLSRQHRFFLDEEAGFDGSLADVYLHQGKLDQAKTLLDQAYSIEPLDEDTNALRGEMALARHNDAEALNDFERAELSGDLAPKWRDKLTELYRAQHGGSDAGMTATMDGEYAKLFPPPFTPAKAAEAQGGHTVLLELFTGSACGPCVGGDLAVDGLLEAYPRSGLVALSFDRHIPEPDPLANPDTEARADMYHSQSTPNYVLDGSMLHMYGNDRAGSKDLYDQLLKQVAAEAALPTEVRLKLTAERGADGQVHARAVVTAGAEAALSREIVMPVEKKPAAAPKDTKDTAKSRTKPPAAAPVAAKPAPPRLVLNFALVEDDVRYSGQNGVRFHRYVVRSLAKAADGGFAVTPGASATLDASFDPAAISAKLRTYLDGYAAHNDRFGPITFLSTDTTMEPKHLYVAAWVQDIGTHRVLDAAIVPVTGDAPSIAAKEGN